MGFSFGLVGKVCGALYTLFHPDVQGKMLHDRKPQWLPLVARFNLASLNFLITSLQRQTLREVW